MYYNQPNFFVFVWADVVFNVQNTYLQLMYFNVIHQKYYTIYSR